MRSTPTPELFQLDREGGSERSSSALEFFVSSFFFVCSMDDGDVSRSLDLNSVGAANSGDAELAGESPERAAICEESVDGGRGGSAEPATVEAAAAGNCRGGDSEEFPMLTLDGSPGHLLVTQGDAEEEAAARSLEKPVEAVEVGGGATAEEEEAGDISGGCGIRDVDDGSAGLEELGIVKGDPGCFGEPTSVDYPGEDVGGSADKNSLNDALASTAATCQNLGSGDVISCCEGLERGDGFFNVDRKCDSGLARESDARMRELNATDVEEPGDISGGCGSMDVDGSAGLEELGIMNGEPGCFVEQTSVDYSGEDDGGRAAKNLLNDALESAAAACPNLGTGDGISDHEGLQRGDGFYNADRKCDSGLAGESVARMRGLNATDGDEARVISGGCGSRDVDGSAGLEDLGIVKGGPGCFGEPTSVDYPGEDDGGTADKNSLNDALASTAAACPNLESGDGISGREGLERGDGFFNDDRKCNNGLAGESVARVRELNSTDAEEAGDISGDSGSMDVDGSARIKELEIVKGEPGCFVEATSVDYPGEDDGGRADENSLNDALESAEAACPNLGTVDGILGCEGLESGDVFLNDDRKCDSGLAGESDAIMRELNAVDGGGSQIQADGIAGMKSSGNVCEMGQNDGSCELTNQVADRNSDITVDAGDSELLADAIGGLTNSGNVDEIGENGCSCEVKNQVVNMNSDITVGGGDSELQGDGMAGMMSPGNAYEIGDNGGYCEVKNQVANMNSDITVDGVDSELQADDITGVMISGNIGEIGDNGDSCEMKNQMVNRNPDNTVDGRNSELQADGIAGVMMRSGNVGKIGENGDSSEVKNQVVDRDSDITVNALGFEPTEMDDGLTNIDSAISDSAAEVVGMDDLKDVVFLTDAHSSAPQVPDSRLCVPVVTNQVIDVISEKDTVLIEPAFQNDMDNKIKIFENECVNVEKDLLGMEKENLKESDLTSLEPQIEGTQQVTYSLLSQERAGFFISDLVWGKVKSHPWWPGQIFGSLDASDLALKYQKKDNFLVAYFADKTFAWCVDSQLKPFQCHFSQMIKQGTTSDIFLKAVNDALEEISRRTLLAMMCSCLVEESYADAKNQNFENAGIRRGRSCCVLDRRDIVNAFQPEKLVEFIRSLAGGPSGETDRLGLVLAQSQLKAFYSSKGYPGDRVFFVGGLVDADVEVSPSTSEMPEKHTTEESSPRISELLVASQGRKKMHPPVEEAEESKKRKSISELMEEETISQLVDVVVTEAPLEVSCKSSLHRSGKKVKTLDISFSLESNDELDDPFEDLTIRSPSSTRIGSFKIGDCIRRAASQLTGSKPVLRNCEPFQKNEYNVDDTNIDASPLAPVDACGMSSSISSDLSPCEMLSQLLLSAQDVMKGDDSVNTIIWFFSEFRDSFASNPQETEHVEATAVKRGRKKGKNPKHASSDTLEPDHMSDMFWSDMLDHDNTEDSPAGGTKRRGPDMRSPRRKRKYTREPAPQTPSGTHSDSEKLHIGATNSGSLPELVAKRPIIGSSGRRADDSLPTQLILCFNKSDSIPSETDLIRIFSRYGPLMEAETEVLRKAKHAKVVFRKRADAETAFSSAGKYSIFGPALISYRLRYLSSPSNAPADVNAQDKEAETNEPVIEAGNAGVPLQPNDQVQEAMPHITEVDECLGVVNAGVPLQPNDQVQEAMPHSTEVDACLGVVNVGVPLQPIDQVQEAMPHSTEVDACLGVVNAGVPLQPIDQVQEAMPRSTEVDACLGVVNADAPCQHNDSASDAPSLLNDAHDTVSHNLEPLLDVPDETESGSASKTVQE